MEPPFTVAVRALCEFAARGGDLDLRFAPAPTALEGIEGHRLVAARRPPGWRAEVALEGRFGDLVVRGRCDGFDPARPRVEEIKTFKGEFARLPGNVREWHRAQARVYGALLCAREGLATLEVALVYLDIGTQREHVLVERCSADELQRFAAALAERFVGWMRAGRAQRAARDAALAALVFPQAAFRPGQRELARAAWRAARDGRRLLAQAPTGIGKTLGTLFPLLKAMPAQRLDKLCFLAAKRTGRALALEALARMQPQAPGLRVLELVAREQACEHPDKACHGESCPLARGFHDRLPAARAAAVGAAALDAPALRGIALAHGVCPYWLGRELARWCDVVVGDYHHWFDEHALLHALAVDDGGRVALLVDEAHNLVERGRAMYSAALDSGALKALMAQAPPALGRPLRRLRRAWQALARDSGEAAYRLLEAPPERFVAALREAAAGVGAWLADEPAGGSGALLDFHFDALHFVRRVDTFDAAHSLFDLTVRTAGRGRESVAAVRNLLPATFLAPRFAAAQAAVLFSATLAPARMYIQALGLPPDTVCLEVASPFAGQLEVHVAAHVSTRWRDRARSLAPIAALLAREYAARPGNYLAFFSSHDYLQQAAQAFAAHAPQVPVWTQARTMDAQARAGFLARFEEGGQGIGFAVLGGAFGEGIDLPGSRCIGAFIATLGLPQPDALNEALRARVGYADAYLHPGLRKVVQAAGRVVRTPGDRGRVVLIDDRYARREVARLLPEWWGVTGRGAGS